METLLLVLHVLFCIFLILVILLQTGKGAGIGAAFGGGSQTVFGPRGAGSFVGKLTGVVATLFMITSMTLAYVASSKSTGVSEKAEAMNKAATAAQDTEPAELKSTDDATSGTDAKADEKAEASDTGVPLAEQDSVPDLKDDTAADEVPKPAPAADEVPKPAPAADEVPKPAPAADEAPKPAPAADEVPKPAQFLQLQVCRIRRPE